MTNTNKQIREQRYCQKCGKKTDIIWNDFLVQFCADCFNPHKTHFEARAFVCRYCERGYDETYPGQNVCVECERSASWGDD